MISGENQHAFCPFCNSKKYLFFEGISSNNLTMRMHTSYDRALVYLRLLKINTCLHINKTASIDATAPRGDDDVSINENACFSFINTSFFSSFFCPDALIVCGGFEARTQLHKITKSGILIITLLAFHAKIN